MKMLFIILYLVVTVFLVIFAVSNRQLVEISIFPSDVVLEVRLFFVMFVCVGLGYAMGRARLVGMWWQNRRQLRALKQTIKNSQRTVVANPPSNAVIKSQA
jgi:uncharacterized integral membrane protein